MSLPIQAQTSSDPQEINVANTMKCHSKILGRVELRPTWATLPGSTLQTKLRSKNQGWCSFLAIKWRLNRNPADH